MNFQLHWILGITAPPLLLPVIAPPPAVVVETDSVRKDIPAIPEKRDVDFVTMQRIHDEVKTPFKYGVVIKGEGKDEIVDSPSIFRSGGHWYMMYIASTKM